MSKLPSDKTLLARAKRELKHLQNEWNLLRAELTEERTRANKAEARAREWEDRFDELLAAFKGKPGGAGDGNGT